MIKTLLLAFVHGFKGGEHTFDDIPEALREGIAKELQGRVVENAIYPRYETQGSLPDAVVDFKEWLSQEVLEREKKAGNNQPTESPTVGVILIAHSMGGLLIADTLLSILDTKPTPKDATPQSIFPTIQGILAFDTPYCGLSRSLFAWGAFAQYQNVSTYYGLASSAASIPSSMFSGSGASAAQSSAQTASAASSQAESSAQDKPAWKLWQMVAMQTGAAGAIAAAGAAAYMNRDTIKQGYASVNKENLSGWWSSSGKTDDKSSSSWWPGSSASKPDDKVTSEKSPEPAPREAKSQPTTESKDEASTKSTQDDSKPYSLSSLSPGNLAYITQALSLVSKENINTGLAYISRENIGSGFTWLSSHLTFVSALVRGQELQTRIQRLASLEGCGFADLYASLGPNDFWSGGSYVAERTFCSIPPDGTKASQFFIKQINKKAKDEIAAHLNMFKPEENKNFNEMRDLAVGLCVNWAKTHGERGVVDHYRLQHKDDVDYKKLNRYTWGEDGGFKEVDKEAEKAKSSWGLGSLTGRGKGQEKKDVEDAAPVTKYVFDKDSGFSEIKADGKRVVLSKSGEVVKEEPLQESQTKEEQASKDDTQLEQAQSGEKEDAKSAASQAPKAEDTKETPAESSQEGEEQVDIENIPGVTHDMNLKS